MSYPLLLPLGCILADDMVSKGASPAPHLQQKDAALSCVRSQQWGRLTAGDSIVRHHRYTQAAYPVTKLGGIFQISVTS